MLDTPDAAGSEARHALRYRADIDGLRAIAILPILLLHCGLTAFRGGFIGVDVFFVISGFLITGIITRELEEERFSLLEFYRRRIVRILPALGAMTAIALVVGCRLLLPLSLKDLGLSAVATSLFSSNFYFYATSGYFAQKAELQPLIHTWSLAVEEQFYLFYPLLLLALRGLRRKALVRVLAGIGILSFAVGGWFAAVDASAGYFLLPARAWELLLGGLVALGAYPRLAPGALRSALCGLALLGIAACALGTSPYWPFPVPTALPPVAGTAFLLAYMPGTTTARLLEAAPLRAIGRISYSLYLWHRPIVAFYMLARPSALTLGDSAILLSASFAAAVLSYRFVEQPALRRWRGAAKAGGPAAPSAAVIGAGLAGLAVFAAMGVAISSQAWQIRALPPPVARVARYQGFDGTPAGLAQFDTGRCFHIPTSAPFDPACLVPDPGQANVLLMGDSHAAQISHALRAALGPAHLMQATAAGCRPLLHGQGLRACRAVAEAAFHTVDYSKVQTVVLAGRWYSEDLPALLDTVRFLRAKGARVVVVGPVVEYDVDVPDMLARAMMAGDPHRVYAFRIADREPLDRRMAPLITSAGAAYVSWFALECPRGRCRLFSASQGPLHIDRTHVSPELAAEMAARIRDAIAKD
ncbi:acyltransferase family protein [Novosphingobium soli]|uniref:Acyltransferase family protein n=1 Tax=Novosphingobium soli TaxID=574956 RepID=A0ABV6CWH9_9SPHN